MSSVLNLILITTALSVVMLLVMLSLYRSKVAGIREWVLANGLVVVALVLFAGRGHIPDLLSIEGANGLLISAGSLLYAGFCRHLEQPVPHRCLVAGGLAALGLLTVFHLVYDVMSLRVVVMSVFNGALTLLICRAVWRALTPGRLRYAYLFTLAAAGLQTMTYVVRIGVFSLDAAGHTPWLPLATWHAVFFSLGALALPSLTLGAVMMANEELIARARHAADHDYLTGAWSRRAFFDLAEAELARAQRAARPLSLLLFDVDHFKAINDTHGHAAGDLVLMDIVRNTEAVLRRADFCARVGGEEFAVLLPDTDARTARLVGERLRETLARAVPVTPDSAPVRCTVSMGIATLGAGDSVSTLLSHADGALYVAKRNGRNVVICAVQCSSCDGNGTGQRCPITLSVQPAGAVPVR